MLLITDLKPGLVLRLVDYGQTDPAYRRKLLAFGLTLGAEMAVQRVAPLGCPVQLEVRGMALRKDEAQHLRWELL